MSDADNLITKLNELNDVILKALADVGNKKIANLSHIESAVNTACEEVLILEPKEAKKVQPLMAEMIGNLETLALSLENFQAELKEKLK